MNVVILGSGERARRVAARIEARGSSKLKICGFIDDSPTQMDLDALEDRYLGKLSDFRRLAADLSVERVVFGLPRRFLADEGISNVISCCEMLGVDVTIPLDLFEMRTAQVVQESLGGAPAFTLSPRVHHKPWKLWVKRALDLAIAVVAILGTLPLWLGAMLAIKLDSKGPIFFVQRRSGRFGKPFPLVKFRTMKVDAEQDLERLKAENEMTGPVFKMREDPRVTRVGRFLRRYSIDELPQLLNVLAGHMSIVGPRPPLPSEVSQYEIDQRGRLSMRPGITCLWQISGRNEIAFGDWVKLDIEYIDRWSLLLDIEIILLTIPAVLTGRGAS